MRQKLFLVMVMTLTLSACATGTDDVDEVTWRGSDSPVGADDGLAWANAQSGEIHLPDGGTLDVEPPVRSFVLAGDGAYVVDERNSDIVAVTDAGAEATGAHAEGLRASPDGRYLAFIDTQAGPLFQSDPHGDVHLLTSVVVDLATSKEIFRSTRGMGDPNKDDLTDLYEDASYGVLGMTNETAWIQPATGDVLAVQLSNGQVTTIDDHDLAETEKGWVRPPLSPPTIGGPANADRSWGIYHVSTPDPEQSSDPDVRIPRDELESADGTRIAPRVDAANWYFEQWVDATTVVGFANTGLVDPDRAMEVVPSSIVSCTVPDGDCTLVPDSDHAVLPVPSLS
jgi:hypothetical protein